jgi:hypothetical protein
LAPALPRARHHGLPIDLVEPDAPALVGDRVPCHLFMPEVAWPDPVGPVLRMRLRRERWLLNRPEVRPESITDVPEPAGFSFLAVIALVPLLLGGALVVVSNFWGRL